jgi:NAD(P)-dependent dehydrogenase (short-subunit alcohol dehydrogenase family)
VIATARASKGISGSERLSELKKAGAAVLELDVTSPQEELDKIAKTAWELYGHIDVLANNAGYIESGALEEMR